MSFVVDDGRILFRTQPGRKLQAMEESPEVCIEACTFDESTGDWLSVIVNVGRRRRPPTQRLGSGRSRCCSRSTPTSWDRPSGLAVFSRWPRCLT